MRTSEKLDQIAPAMVAALGRMKNPKKDSRANAGKFSYTYLSLPELTEYVRVALEKVGLTATQEIIDADGATGVLTRFWHLSGQWVELGPCVIQSGPTAQERGSASTYARRYALAAAVGLAADEDDDGAKASQHSEPTATRTSHLGGGSEYAGTGATQVTPPASVPAPSSAGEAGTAPVEAPSTEAEGAGEGPGASVPATPEQRTRLLAVYKKPSEAKAKAVQLFDRFEKIGDVLIADLTSSEVESLILAAASA